MEKPSKRSHHSAQATTYSNAGTTMRIQQLPNQRTPRPPSRLASTLIQQRNPQQVPQGNPSNRFSSSSSTASSTQAYGPSASSGKLPASRTTQQSQDEQPNTNTLQKKLQTDFPDVTPAGANLIASAVENLTDAMRNWVSDPANQTTSVEGVKKKEKERETSASIQDVLLDLADNFKHFEQDFNGLSLTDCIKFAMTSAFEHLTPSEKAQFKERIGIFTSSEGISSKQKEIVSIALNALKATKTARRSFFASLFDPDRYINDTTSRTQPLTCAAREAKRPYKLPSLTSTLDQRITGAPLPSSASHPASRTLDQRAQLSRKQMQEQALREDQAFIDKVEAFHNQDPECSLETAIRFAHPDITSTGIETIENFSNQLKTSLRSILTTQEHNPADSKEEPETKSSHSSNSLNNGSVATLLIKNILDAIEDFQRSSIDFGNLSLDQYIALIITNAVKLLTTSEQIHFLTSIPSVDTLKESLLIFVNSDNNITSIDITLTQKLPSLVTQTLTSLKPRTDDPTDYIISTWAEALIQAASSNTSFKMHPAFKRIARQFRFLRDNYISSMPFSRYIYLATLKANILRPDLMSNLLQRYGTCLDELGSLTSVVSTNPEEQLDFRELVASIPLLVILALEAKVDVFQNLHSVSDLELETLFATVNSSDYNDTIYRIESEMRSSRQFDSAYFFQNPLARSGYPYRNYAYHGRCMLFFKQYVQHEVALRRALHLIDHLDSNNDSEQAGIELCPISITYKATAALDDLTRHHFSKMAIALMNHLVGLEDSHCQHILQQIPTVFISHLAKYPDSVTPYNESTSKVENRIKEIKALCAELAKQRLNDLKQMEENILQSEQNKNLNKLFSDIRRVSHHPYRDIFRDICKEIDAIYAQFPQWIEIQKLNNIPLLDPSTTENPTKFDEFIHHLWAYLTDCIDRAYEGELYRPGVHLDTARKFISSLDPITLNHLLEVLTWICPSKLTPCARGTLPNVVELVRQVSEQSSNSIARTI